MPCRRREVVGAALAGAVAAGRGAWAQQAGAGFPERPVRIVVPFAAGGTTDILARALALRLQDAWGQPVVAENRTGAGGTIGTEAVAKAAPDGHTLLLGTTATQAITPHLYPRLAYDAARDFAPVATLAEVPMLLTVHPAVPARSVAELVAVAKARPGELSYGSSGQGAITHLAMELFRFQAGIELTHVPYRGSSQAVTDLVAGRIQLMMDHAPTVLGHFANGALRPLGVARARRVAALPEVPPIAEAVPGVEVSSWFGVLAPAGTPAAVVERLHAAIARAMAAPEMGARLGEQGAEPLVEDPAGFGARITRDAARWAEVVRRAGVRLG